jgi:hypothetical protein
MILVYYKFLRLLKNMKAFKIYFSILNIDKKEGIGGKYVLDMNG